MDSLEGRETEMIDFMNEINKTIKRKEEADRFRNSPEIKKEKMKKVKAEAKAICLDKVFQKIYQDALPITPEYKSGHVKDLEDEFRTFTSYSAPKGLEYYVRESIKKGNKASKMLMESVEKLVNGYFFEQQLHIDTVKNDDIKFDEDSEEIRTGLQKITDKMGAEEISEVIQNNVKNAAIQDIVRQKEREEQLRSLTEELRNDPAITTEAALNKALSMRGLKDRKFYTPSLFEGIMVNKMTLLKESGVDLPAIDLGKKAFVESVKEMTGLSVLKAMNLIPLTITESKELGKKYAQMKIDGSAVNLRESASNYYKESGEMELFSEGANLDIRRIFKDNKKEVVAQIKLAKKGIKQKEYTEAKAHLAEGRRILGEMEKEINGIDGSGIPSVVLGALFSNVMFIGRYLLSSLLGPLGLNVMGLVVLFKRIQAMVDEHSNGKDYWDAEDFNFYRNGILVRLNEYSKALKKIESILDSATDGQPLKKTDKKELNKENKKMKKR